MERSVFAHNISASFCNHLTCSRPRGLNVVDATHIWLLTVTSFASLTRNEKNRKSNIVPDFYQKIIWFVVDFYQQKNVVHRKSKTVNDLFLMIVMIISATHVCIDRSKESLWLLVLCLVLSSVNNTI